jgi:hypothetical protein
MDSSDEEIDTNIKPGNFIDIQYNFNIHHSIKLLKNCNSKSTNLDPKKYYKSSDDESAEDDGYDSQGDYIGTYGNKNKSKMQAKDDDLYGNVWSNNGTGPRRGKIRNFREFNKLCIGLGKKSVVDMSKGMSFVKKETIVNKVTAQTMVKEAINKTELLEPSVEQRKFKFKKQMSEMPVLFGKGGSKPDVDKSQHERVLKQEEKKYEKYGKGFKFMKMMGYTADQHREIVHAVKRDEKQGLGIMKEKNTTFEKKGKKGGNKKDDEAIKIPKKNSDLPLPQKPSDENFLKLLMKSNKDISDIRSKNRGKQSEGFSASDLMNSQRTFKDMNIIDETGGQAEAMFMKNNQYKTDIPGKYFIRNILNSE